LESHGDIRAVSLREIRLDRVLEPLILSEEDISGKGSQIALVVLMVKAIGDLNQNKRELHIKHSLDIQGRCVGCPEREVSDLYIVGREGVKGLLIILSYLESRLGVVQVVVVFIYETDSKGRVRALLILIKSEAINLDYALLFQVLRV
jgi:hypothetical protein